MNKKVVLLILDGLGINNKKEGNAVALANTSNLDKLTSIYPNTELEASGKGVGLPDGQMGNSEVGHLNIGAGRVVYTGLSIINNAIETGKFNDNKAFNDALNHVEANQSKLHLISLVSDGGVHASWDHLVALIKMCKKTNAVLHVVTDGRDVSPKSAVSYLSKLLPILKENNVKLASITGRYYTMDRDKNWDRVTKGYDAILGNSENKFIDPMAYCNENYANNVTDEFFLPAVNANYSADEIGLNDNDSVIVANFRPDRSRQISHMIYGSNYYDYKNDRKHNIFFVTMMNYEGITPSAIAYPPTALVNPLGKVLEDNSLSQARIAETEKYAHVTFFFDGGIEINYRKEEKIICPSPKVATYDLKPEMSAYEVCNEILNKMDSTDVIIANFANGDMVGHTGNLDAAIKAVEVVDECVGMIYNKAQETNSTLFITADHGNADIMIDEKGGPFTSHTTNRVPFIVTDSNVKLNTIGKLSNIAPTILKYLGIVKPIEMDEEPLI